MAMRASVVDSQSVNFSAVVLAACLAASGESQLPGAVSRCFKCATYHGLAVISGVAALFAAYSHSNCTMFRNCSVLTGSV